MEIRYNRKKLNKILFIIPTLGKGGAEKILFEIWNGFKYKNKYLAIYNSKNTVYNVDNAINLDKFHKKGILFWIINYAIRVFRLYKLKKKLKINISISFLNNASLLNLLTKSRERCILSLHTLPSEIYKENKIYGKIYSILLKSYFNKAEKIIVPSKGICNDLITNFKIKKERIFIINNPYDIEKTRQLSKKSIDPEILDKFKGSFIITVGRLTTVKGYKYLINIIKLIKEKYKKDIKLVIIGEGDLYENLLDLVKNLNIKENIMFLGFKRNPYKYISRALLYIMSSLYEGFPNVLVEALICGVPVISTDCNTGPREILAPDTNFRFRTKSIEYAKYGVLVPPFKKKFQPGIYSKEEYIMADAIVSLLNNKRNSEYYKKLGVKRANMLETKKIIKQYKEVILNA